MARTAHALLLAAAAAAAFCCIRAHPEQADHHTNRLVLNSSEERLSMKELDMRKKMGVTVPINERFPHAVLFERTCGGTIISPTWILTAGHCTLFMSGHTVVAATNNTADGSGVRVAVKRLVIHPKYSVGPYWLNPHKYNIKQVAARYDFLLAELEEPLPLDGRRMLAAKLNEQPHLPAGLDVAFAGFGAARHGDVMRPHMHAMELTIQSDEVCAQKLEQYDTQDMFCAQGRPPKYDSACNGDSGSGLVDGQGWLLGVASWVENDALDCSPGALVVFSRLSAVRGWIRHVTGV